MPFITDLYEFIYYNFTDKQQWFADAFEMMTIEEFMSFIDYCYERFNVAASAGDGTELIERKGLIVTIARKEFEAANFVDDLSLEQRLASIKSAEATFALGRGFYDKLVVPDLDAAWAASKDRAATYGYAASGVFEVLQPHYVFRRGVP